MAEYWESDELKELAEELMAAHHPHLASAKIAYLFRDKASRKSLTWDGSVQQVVWGNFVKMGKGKYEILTGKDLVLEFGYDIWKEYTVVQRRYALDSLLSTMAGEEDDKNGGEMKFWSIPYPIQAFPDVVMRHGLPFDELRDMTRVMQSELSKSTNAIFARSAQGDPSDDDAGDEFLDTAEDTAAVVSVGTPADANDIDADDDFLMDLTSDG